LSPRERLKSPRLRLFLALELPQQLIDLLVRWRDGEMGGLANARLVRPEGLHVTLVFLGYKAERDVSRIAELCFSRPVEAFELEPEALLGVPPRRPRLYALSLLDPWGALSAWQEELSRRLAEARLYEPEKRPFWPHVTLLRAKRNSPLAALEGSQLPEELRRPFRADRATLYRSTLAPQGAVYEPLAAMELTGARGTP
jgi:2'-5' RNA ligase